MLECVRSCVLVSVSECACECVRVRVRASVRAFVLGVRVIVRECVGVCK